jgi:hypothetical protein
MNILCIAQLEDRTLADEQVQRQTLQPDRTIFYIDENPAVGITERRKKIAENHSKLVEIVKAYKPDLVLQIEGDSVMPSNTLETLVNHYKQKKAIYSAVQVGRHGLYCIGAWHVANDRTSFESVDYKQKGLQEVDAMGLYCFIADTKTWLSGKCEWNGEKYGPDVNYFLSISKNKYVDMNLQIGHKHKDGIITVDQPSTCNARFWLENNIWQFKQLD